MTFMTSTSSSHRALALALTLAASGCAAPELGHDGVTTQVGRAGGDAAIAVATRGAEVSVYLCGGPSTFASLTRWFEGAVGADERLSLTSDDGAVLTGDLAAGRGEIATPDGQTLAYRVSAAGAAVEGLYEAEGACHAGVVAGDLDGDGQTHFQGAACDAEGKVAQVTPILPVAVTERGLAVRVLTTPATTLFVERVKLP